MTSGDAALPILFGIVALGSGIGFYARRKRPPSLEEWAVGGRRFGAVMVWMLMAGELFTTFTLLGLSGWIYSRGAPILYALGFMSLAQVVWFYLGPRLWEEGRKHNLQTLPDYYASRYGSRALTVAVAACSLVFLLIYLQLQLTGLGIIVGIASSGRIGRASAMTVAALLIAGFVFASGVRGIAWVSILKDVLLTLVALVIGFGLPGIYFGGIGPMFAALEKAHPHHLVMPGATRDLGHAWYISSVLLGSLGYLWPHLVGSCFTARSGDVIRRNTIALPLYNVAIFLVVFAGCSALLIVPGLKNGDLALLLAVQRTFPPWFLGLVGGAGALTAMVPAAIQVLAASTLFAKNLCPRSSTTDEQRLARLARLTVILLTAAALLLALRSSATLVTLLLTAYAGIGQFFPGVLFGLFWPRASSRGIFAGLVVGVGTAALLIATRHDPFFGLSAGFVALLANFAVVVGVSLANRVGQREAALC